MLCTDRCKITGVMQASYILCSLVHVLEKYTFFFNKHTYFEGVGWGGRFFSKRAQIESNIHSKYPIWDLNPMNFHVDLNFDLTFNFCSPGSCDSFSSN